MPIHFKCKYCDSKLSITRKKAGLQVQCPACYKYLVVPPLPEEKSSSAPKLTPQTTQSPAPDKKKPNSLETMNPDIVLGTTSKSIPAPPPPPVYFDEFDDDNPIYDVVQLSPNDMSITWQKLLRSKKAIILTIVTFIVGFLAGFATHFLTGKSQ